MRVSPKLTLLVLLFLFCLDTGYAFLQYFHQPLDGDMAWNLVPAAEVQPILGSPLGLEALLEGRRYPNPNRFFSHWTYREYLLKVPLALQSFCEPITSVYLASALAKLLTHLGLILVLVRAITGSWRPGRKTLIVAACLLAPFFQSGEFRSHIGIVDAATTYVFFYALPAALALLYVLPFLDFLLRERKKFSTALLLLWVPLAFVVCLSGPLNPGAILVALLLSGLAWLSGRLKLANIPLPLIGLALLAGGLSVYSLYLGRFNSLTINSEIPLMEVYAKLPLGIFRQFTGKLAFPVLFLMLGLNYGLLRKFAPGHPTRFVFGWVLAFAAIYFVLLPLGGFRSYRATILRYDTILPATLAFIALYAGSSLVLLKSLPRRWRTWYAAGLIAVAAIYTNADRYDQSAYDCERAALEKIAAATQGPLALTGDCGVVLWQPYPTPDWSELTSRLLVRWRITEKPILYYHSETKAPPGR
jgi:hypothetical protein